MHETMMVLGGEERQNNGKKTREKNENEKEKEKGG